MRTLTIQLLLVVGGLWLSLGFAQTVSVDPSEVYIAKNAVDFTPGCTIPSAIYKSPDSLFDDATAPIGHSFVVVRYIVTTDGLPVDIHIDSGSSSAVQAIYAMRQLKDWKFSQPQCDGKILAMRMSMRWEFTANPKNCPPDGCTLPWAATNHAIVGLRLPAPPAPKPVPVEDLSYERLQLVRKLRSLEAVLSTRSFVDRAKIYCSSVQEAFPMLPSLGTFEDMQIAYSEMEQKEHARERAPTQEEAYRSEASRQLLSSAYENMSTCESGIAGGFWQRLPSDERLREMAEQSRTRIADIDKELAQRK